MRPAFHHDLATARIADLHHHAARERMAQGAIRGRRAQPHHRARLLPGHAVTVLARVLPPAGGHRLAPPR
jgi:hypothetical protein